MVFLLLQPATALENAETNLLITCVLGLQTLEKSLLYRKLPSHVFEASDTITGGSDNHCIDNGFRAIYYHTKSKNGSCE